MSLTLVIRRQMTQSTLQKSSRTAASDASTLGPQAVHSNWNANDRESGAGPSTDLAGKSADLPGPEREREKERVTLGTVHGIKNASQQLTCLRWRISLSA